jgi:hypothetical protein
MVKSEANKCKYFGTEGLRCTVCPCVSVNFSGANSQGVSGCGVGVTWHAAAGSRGAAAVRTTAVDGKHHAAGRRRKNVHGVQCRLQSMVAWRL